MLEQVLIAQALVADGAWGGLVLRIGPVAAAGLCLLVLLCVVSICLIYRGLVRRLQITESRLESQITRTQGPTVRQLCRGLIESLKLRIPRSELPRSKIREEDVFIRGLVYHLKRRHRKRLAQETRFRQLRSELIRLNKAITVTPQKSTLQPETIQQFNNLIQESETQARRFETLLDMSRTLQPRIKEAVDVRQQLENLQDIEGETRESLQTLHESLDRQLDRRRELLNRIDSQLRERQIQLVTDILRAEGGHLELSKLMDKVEETVTSLGDMTDWTKLGRDSSGPLNEQSASRELADLST